MTKRRNRIHSLHTVVVDVESDESRVKGTVESTNTLGDGAAAPNVTGDGAGGDRSAVVPGTAAVDLAASFGFIGHVRELCPLPWQWPHWYPDPTPDARPELVRTTRGRPLLDLAREVLAIADAGLKARDRRNAIGETEQGFLDPLREVVRSGKVPAEVARRAQLRGVPVVALAGSLGHGAPAVHDVGIGAIASIITVPMPLSEAVANGEKLLADAAERTMRMILLGAAVSARAGQRKRKKAV